MIQYLDSSYILGVILNPNDDISLGNKGGVVRFTSRLSQVEVFRNVMKRQPEHLQRASEILLRIEFIEMTNQVIDNASAYPSEITLKSSDAIHMATAELLLDVDDVLVTFDKQMALNAERLGIKVLTSF
ncbi:PIN_MT3492-like domain containing protein [Candidatus Nanopelagicaceae bacterium]